LQARFLFVIDAALQRLIDGESGGIGSVELAASRPSYAEWGRTSRTG